MNTADDQLNNFSPEEDLSGRQLGDYRLLRRLGSGAMAVVYLAEQCSLHRQVALKILRGELVDDETYVRRFQREAEAAAALVHANIVQIHEVGRVGRIYFIAQEYVEGQNLRDWIDRNEKPALPHILSIMCQVAAALNKAAGRGIVHRDIKPENILLTRGGEIKVADFGLARLSKKGDPVELTQVGITLGTPLYMSPEQVEGKPLDPRSDLYSFGVTCYHLIAGSPPFTGQTPLSVAVQHLKKEPEPLENLRSDLPRELLQMIHRMLAKDPKQRYQSATQLLQDLRRVQQDHLANQWPDDLPGWASGDLETTSFGPVQATQRLQAVMETTSMAVERGGRRIWLVAAVFAMFFVGSALALYVLKEKPLVAAQPNHATVTRANSALAQYIKASRLDTLPAWEAVVENFPEDKYPEDKSHVRRAKQQMVRIHLSKNNFADALALCEELSRLAPSDTDLGTFAQAGRVVALSGQGKYADSEREYQKYAPWNERLLDKEGKEKWPWMSKLLNSAQKKNEQNLEKENPR